MTEGKTLSEAEILAGIARGEPGYEVLAARLPEKRERLAPRWTAGDTWTVETYYRQMQAAREVWAGPQRWTFRVEGETSFRDRPCFEITAVREDEVDATPTTYYVTRDSHRLAGVHTTVAEQGKKRAITYLPDSDGDDRTPAAVKAPFAVAPFDLPPLDADARVVPPGLGDAAPLLASPEERARYPRPEALLGASGEHLEIEYASPIDRTTVFQRWSRKDLRWPVLSRTETTLSFRR